MSVVYRSLRNIQRSAAAEGGATLGGERNGSLPPVPELGAGWPVKAVAFAVVVVGLGVAVYVGVGALGQRSAPVSTAAPKVAAATVETSSSGPTVSEETRPSTVPSAGGNGAQSAKGTTRQPIAVAADTSPAAGKGAAHAAARRHPKDVPHAISAAPVKLHRVLPRPATEAHSAPLPAHRARPRPATPKIEVSVVSRQAQAREAVAALRHAIRAGDRQTARRSLAKLAAVRGADNPYVLKMRAYWRLSLKDYKGAETALGQVLDIHPDDVEAGVNMVIAQLHQGERSAAKQRAEQLMLNHPNDPRVRELQGYFR